jgi:hypothetical protein
MVNSLLYPPNVLALSRLADCAYVGSVYNSYHRRHHTSYLLAEGQVGSNRGLGEIIFSNAESSF